MATVSISSSAIPLWKGDNGTIEIALPLLPLAPGAAPVLTATFGTNTGAAVSFAAHGTAGIRIQSGTTARIVPIFQEDRGEGAGLVDRFQLGGMLRPDNLLLALEIGGTGALEGEGSFSYTVLSANARLKAGADATYVAIRSFPRATLPATMFAELLGTLTLPGAITAPPSPGSLVSFEYGGMLQFTVGASAGYQIKGTRSFRVSEIALSEHCGLSVIGKLSLSGSLAGRFSIDITAGTEPGFARVVVKRRRQSQLAYAADATATADLSTTGLPPSGKEFLCALLGLEARNWLNLFDGIVTKAGQVDSIDKLKARLDTLALQYLNTLAGSSEVKAVQQKIAEAVASYRNLGDTAVTLFDRYFDRLPELAAKLEHLRALESWNKLQGEIDPVLWNILRQLTDGSPLEWILDVARLPELKRRADSVLALIRDTAHQEIRELVRIAKEHFQLDPLMDELETISSPAKLQALAGEKIGGFVQRLIGAAIDSLGAKALDEAFHTVRQVVAARGKFCGVFDRIVKEAATQSFTTELHAVYSSATEHQALIDVEIDLRTPDGLHFLAAAGRGDFQEILADYRPAIVRLRQGLLTHQATRSATLQFHVAGWHRAFNYEAMHRIVTNTAQQIRDGGNGLLTVFTTTDMTLSSERRKRGTRSEQAVLASFLLRFLSESKLADSAFDRKTLLYALEVITGMSASYSVTFTGNRTSPADLDAYLKLAAQLGLDRAGATRAGLEPVLELRDGSYGKTESFYEVRYTEAGLRRLFDSRPDPRQIRTILRTIVLANYAGHPALRDAGWLYASDDARRLYEEAGNNFVNAETVVQEAQITLRSPIAGIAPPSRFDNTFQIRNTVAILFRIEDRILRAFADLRDLLDSGAPIPAAALEKRLESFGEALQAFDEFDLGENAIFAVFDGLILLATSAAEARASSLTFNSTKDNAAHTKLFTLKPVTVHSIPD